MSGYVVVTMIMGEDGKVIPTAPVHVYGSDVGQPLDTRAKAQTLVRKLKANDRMLHPDDPREVLHLIRQVLGGEPS